MHLGWPEAQVHTRGRHRAENSLQPMEVRTPQIEAHGQPLTPSNSGWVAIGTGGRAR
jgi:hypothetical protein